MVSVVLAVSMSMTACVGNGMEALVDDPDLSKQAAIEQTVEYMKRTEASLPEGVALSAESDAPGAVNQGRSNSGSISCSGSDGVEESDPHMVQIDYFVTGVPEGKNVKYFSEIRRLWESWGFTPTAKPDGQWAAYENEEGYVLDVQQYGEPGTLSIGGQTPCIAGDKLQGSDEVPRRIGGDGS